MKSVILSNRPFTVQTTLSVLKCIQYFDGTPNRLYRCRYLMNPAISDLCFIRLAVDLLIPNSLAITEHDIKYSLPARMFRFPRFCNALLRRIRNCTHALKTASVKWRNWSAVSWIFVLLNLLSLLKDRNKYHVPSLPIQSIFSRRWNKRQKCVRDFIPMISMTGAGSKSLTRTCPCLCTILIAQNKRISELLPERIISFANCNGIFSLSIRTQSTHITIKNQASL